jgi:peptidoglycan/xylan/chitin deacetylase (PgdA/CDA1 family)
MIAVILGIFALFVLILIYASIDFRLGIFVNTIYQLSAKGNNLVLTFNDGPHPEITPQILDILKRYKIQAIFFCIGENIEKNKLLAKRIIDEGHLIGNHTNRHSKSFPFYSSRRMRSEIDDCNKEIISIRLANYPRLFRPPFGITSPSLWIALKNSGYTVVGWNISVFCTVQKNPDKAIRIIHKKIKPGGIILLHDTQNNTPHVLKRVIKYALTKGYVFVRGM